MQIALWGRQLCLNLKKTYHEQLLCFLLSADMVAKEHFGGFMTNSNHEELGGQKQKSWKERMEEMIAKSKKEKVCKCIHLFVCWFPELSSERVSHIGFVLFQIVDSYFSMNVRQRKRKPGN